MSYILFNFFDEPTTGPSDIVGIVEMTGFAVKFSTLENVTVTWSGFK